MVGRSRKRRHRRDSPEELRQRQKRFKDKRQEGGNTGRSLRGNPEALESQRIRKTSKVTNLGRGGRLERVKPNFLLAIL
jgi:hypothetical protein